MSEGFSVMSLLSSAMSLQASLVQMPLEEGNKEGLDLLRKSLKKNDVPTKEVKEM
jgi:hypothetical protein